MARTYRYIRQNENIFDKITKYNKLNVSFYYLFDTLVVIMAGHENK
jgi:hypothetical protein